MQNYLNRSEAGKILAQELKIYKKKPKTLVLALPRGGVPVAYEIAHALSIPMDVFIVRKLGVPGYEELAMGAIASGGVVVFNEDLRQRLHIPKSAVDEVIKAEKKELKRRELLYRKNKRQPTLKNKTILLVDDGIATGATMKAAVKAIKQKKPAKLIIAVPVAAQETYHELATEVDQIICPLILFHFTAVGIWYSDFSQTSDEEVSELLERAT